MAPDISASGEILYPNDLDADSPVPQIYTMPAGGGAAAPITSDPTSYHADPPFSPDGTRILYLKSGYPDSMAIIRARPSEHSYRWFDADVEEGGSYRYDLVAVARNGELAKAQSVTLVVPAGTLQGWSVSPSVGPGPLDILFRSLLPEGGEIAVHNVFGQLVRVLALPPGCRLAHWDGTSSAGTACSGGVYYLRFRGSSVAVDAKVVIVR